jgi:hypothetical protein
MDAEDLGFWIADFRFEEIILFLMAEKAKFRYIIDLFKR